MVRQLLPNALGPTRSTRRLALESGRAKYFKESDLWMKTKTPVAVVVTDNVLPKDEFKAEKVGRRRKYDD